MKYWRILLALSLSALLCWMPVMAPFAAYAASVHQESSDDAAGDNGISSNQVSTVDEGSLQAGQASSSTDQSTSSDSEIPYISASEQAASDAASAESADAASAENDDAAPSTAPSEGTVTKGSTGFAGNSFRFSNGEPLSGGSEEDGGISLFSLRRPDGVTGWGIDVSEFQGSIDWAKVKAAGVDFAIIRAGYGHGGVDDRFIENMRGVLANGIPFGVYLYSYAYDAASAQDEADWVLNRLSAAGATPSDLAFPVYYDLENEHPASRVPAGVDDGNQYRIIDDPVTTLAAMAQTFSSRVRAAGYTPGIYANLNWWRNYLTSPVFNQWTRWVAQYNSTDDYEGVHSMWQYSSKGRVDGISGNVDVNYLYDKSFVRMDGFDAVNIADGTYYINAQKRDASGITANGASVSLEAGSSSAAQRFAFSRQTDGSYVISLVGSNLVLGVAGGAAANAAAVQVEQPTGASSQRWLIRDSGSGYFIQSALGNWVLDLANGSVQDGTPVRLYQPNLSDAQKFMLASASTVSLVNEQVNLLSAADSSFAVHVAGDSRDDFALMEIAGKQTRDSYLFRLIPAGNGIYEIVNIASGKAVEAKGGGTSNGSAVGQYTRNGTLSQHWAAADNGDGSYALINMKSGKALDVTNGMVQSGTKLQLYTPNGTVAQGWRLAKGVSEAEAEKSLAAQHKGDLPDGTYTFSSSKRSGSVFEARNGGIVSGTALQLYQSNGTDAQKWRVTHDGDYVVFTNAKSGLVLDVPSGKAASGTALQLYQSNGTKAQRWIAVKGGDGSYELLSAVDPTKALEIKWGQTDNGTSIWLYDRNQTASQRWNATKTQSSRDALDELASSHKADMPDGTYVLASNKDSSRAFALASGSIQLAAFNAKDDQRWVVTHDDDGYITLTSVSTGKALDARNGSTDNGTLLQTYDPNGSWAQKWIAVKETSGEITLLSGKALDVAVDCRNGSMDIGNPLQLYTSNGTAAQRWVARNVSTVSSDLKRLASANRDAIADGIYAIVGGSSSSHMVLDVAGGSMADGGNVQLFSSNATPAQRWRISHDADGFVMLTSVKSGKALEVAGGWAQLGRNVQQWASNGTAAQKWIFERNADGSYRILSGLWEGLSLDIVNGSLQNYTNVQVYSSASVTAQTWFAIPDKGESAAPGKDFLAKGAWGTLSSASSQGKVIDIASGSRDDGVQARPFASNGTMAQLFTFEFSDGYYRVISAKSGKALSVDADDVVPGGGVVQRRVSSSDLQLFAARSNGDGSFSLLSKATGFALTMDGSSLTVQCDSDAASQRFTYSQLENLLAEGTYTIKLSMGSTALDVKNGSTSDGGAIQVYSSNGTFSQMWSVLLVSGKKNTYTIEALNSGKRLTMTSGGSVQQQTASDSVAQQWTVSFDSGYVVLRNVAYPTRVLSASNAGSGSMVGSTTAVSSSLQRFDLIPTDAVIPSGVYWIRSASLPSNVLDVQDASVVDGANVQVWSNNNSGAQKWNISRNSDGTYTILNARSHKALEIANGYATSGNNVRQWASNDTAAQRWLITYASGGWKITSAKLSSLVIDAAGGTANPGVNIQVFTDNGTSAQRFTFAPTNYVQEYIGFQNPSPFFQVSMNSVTIPHMGQGIFGYRTPSRIVYNATKQDCINAMITRAYDYLGTTPYIWDYSCAPGVGVDCAGLVMQALYATGMDLMPFNPWDHYYTPGHDQYANGMWDSPRFMHLDFSQRQRGDLVCYPGHIAIYLGNDTILEAASPQYGVRISNVYSSPNIKGVLRPFV